jgi:surfeit locus 1 family protein
VNRGFVPDALRNPTQRAAGQIAGATTVRGLARLTSPPAAFTPDNDPTRNIWYRRDVRELDASAFRDNSASAPFVIEAEALEVPGGWPKGGVTRVSLPNRHLEYALTWWGLAGTLLAVYAAFVIGRLRRREDLLSDAS